MNISLETGKLRDTHSEGKVTMTIEQIIAANRASANEQLEQDERNEVLKAEMRAEELLSRPAPQKILYFPEDTKEDFLQDIQRENVEASQERINYHE
jgi:hypothetical protein